MFDPAPIELNGFAVTSMVCDLEQKGENFGKDRKPLASEYKKDFKNKRLGK